MIAFSSASTTSHAQNGCYRQAVVFRSLLDIVWCRLSESGESRVYFAGLSD